MNVVGIDLSTRAIDLVKLAENSNEATWVRCELTGATAWERTLQVRDQLAWGKVGLAAGFWDDVYLVAIEAPYGRGQPGTNALLNRVVGAVMASLPAALRHPERCWLVKPDEWKTGLGLKAKPTHGDLQDLAPDIDWFLHQHKPIARDENARDAYCMAKWARDTNARAVEKALTG